MYQLTGITTRRDQDSEDYLKTLGLRTGGIEVVSCPTCGRTQIDLIGLANQVEEMVADIPLDIKVAVMAVWSMDREKQKKQILELPEEGRRTPDQKRRDCKESKRRGTIRDIETGAVALE